MKNIKNILLFLIVVVASSCGADFLSPEPTSAISAEDYYTTEVQLESAVINMYDAIQGVNAFAFSSTSLNHGVQIEFYLTEMRSDNTRTKSGGGLPQELVIYDAAATNTFVGDYYRSFYNVIFRANTVLANLGVASEENSANIEAEAKFVRAYAYFNLVRLYGDIPLVESIIGIEDTEIQFNRVAASEVYDLIISDLETAVSGLDNTHKFRASKAAAQTTLAKVYLTLGTEYLLAQQLLEDVMISGYALEPNFKDVFYNEGNDEIIFAIGFESDNSNDSQDFSSEWLNGVGRSSGVNYVTDEAKVVIDALGGNRKEYSYRTDVAEPSQSQVVKYLPNGDNSLDIEPTSANARLAGNDFIVLRYSDVLLLHVEAIMAGGNSTSVQTALDSFELVRLRAGLLGDDDNTITKQELLDERRVELAFENHRFFDLIRFGEAMNVLSDYSTNNGYNFSSTDLLLPIPQGEINLSNGAMQQNPGY